jgi:hypothetical protein
VQADSAAPAADRRKTRRCTRQLQKLERPEDLAFSLAIENREENQDADGHHRNFGCDIDETSKGFFLNVDVHFTVLMISHFAFPS